MLTTNLIISRLSTLANIHDSHRRGRIKASDEMVEYLSINSKMIPKRLLHTDPVHENINQEYAVVLKIALDKFLAVVHNTFLDSAGRNATPFMTILDSFLVNEATQYGST